MLRFIQGPIGYSTHRLQRSIWNPDIFWYMMFFYITFWSSIYSKPQVVDWSAVWIYKTTDSSSIHYFLFHFVQSILYYIIQLSHNCYSPFSLFISHTVLGLYFGYLLKKTINTRLFLLLLKSFNSSILL